MIKSYLSGIAVLTVINISAQQVTDRIKLNQCGFYPKGSKMAVVTGTTDTTDFYITSTNLADTFYKGRLSEEKASGNSSVKTRTADFSSLQSTGSFVVWIPGIGHSYVFQISDNVLHQAAVAALKGYYYQRASIPLEEKYAGKWHRSAGHPDTQVYIHPSAATAERPAGTIISTPGGWYDAGDYNKYIVNSGITMGTLLSAYEDFPAYFAGLVTHIPESGNAVPDILNEVTCNLRWTLSMQDPYDGGVYNKCTNASFDGMVMPGITKEKRYVVQKGTAATLDFAAVTAQAGRILKPFGKQLPGLADSCIKAAKKAWAWSQKNPSAEYNQNEMNKLYEPAVITGGYGDKSFADEWSWAAAELFITTGNRSYYEAYVKNKAAKPSLPSWANVEMLGHYSLLRFRKALPAYAARNLQAVQEQVIRLADGYISNAGGNAFQTVMGGNSRDFNWGSNSTAANQGIVLINAYLLTKNKIYIDYALTNMDYLLGRNATGYCFLTGTGSKSTAHPHHRPSVADGVKEPVPGLLAGGPNPGKQDHCSYEFSEPETTYADIDCSYASNEIAINWNAPMVYLANAIEMLQKELGKQ